MAFLGPSLRRRRVTDRPAARVVAAVLVSLALNALVLFLLFRLGAFEMPAPKRQTQVALAPLSAQQWAQNRAIGGVAPPRAPPVPRPAAPAPRPQAQAQAQPKPPEPEHRAPGQIVDVAPSKNSTPPKSTRFLSDRDNTVDKETRSRFAGTRAYDNTLPSPSDGLKKAPQPVDRKGDGGKAAEAKAGEEAPKGTGADKIEVPKQPAQDKLALAPKPEQRGSGELPVAPREDRQRVPGSGDTLAVPGAPGAPDGGGQKKTGRLDARLLPDAQSLSRIAGGPAPDRLDGVDVGDATSLNTRGFKYATFINRVGLAIYREWDPNRAYLSRDPDGTVYPQRDRTTGLQLVLGPDGALRYVKVFEPSGLEFLDAEIVRAARAAAPFPNPPPGLVDNGEIRLTFYYTLESRHASHVRVVLPPSAGQRPYPE